MIIDELSQYVVSHVYGIEELDKANRRKKFKSTGYLQIRVKPTVKDISNLAAQKVRILNDVYTVLKRGTSLGIEDVKQHELSPNSGKFSSVSFTQGGIKYDVVIATGENKGESFEKHLLAAMYDVAFNCKNNDLGAGAWRALELASPQFKLSNIQGIEKRTGSTKRGLTTELEKTGQIIGDYIVALNSGGAQFISVKDDNGRYFANFGAAGLVNERLKVVVDSPLWKDQLAHFGFDHKNIEDGYQAIKKQTNVKFEHTQKVNVKCGKTSKVYKMMVAAWGVNYFYLRRTKDENFECMHITKEFLDENLLHNLRITEIRYPYFGGNGAGQGRKYFGVILESDTARYMIDVRNSSDAHDLRPMAIRISKI